MAVSARVRCGNCNRLCVYLRNLRNLPPFSGTARASAGLDGSCPRPDWTRPEVCGPGVRLLRAISVSIQRLACCGSVLSSVLFSSSELLCSEERSHNRRIHFEARDRCGGNRRSGALARTHARRQDSNRSQSSLRSRAVTPNLGCVSRHRAAQREGEATANQG